MTPTEEHYKRILSVIQKHPDDFLRSLARDLNLQDPAPDREALLLQIVPILMIDEDCQFMEEHFNADIPYLLAVREGEGPETVGWFSKVDRKNQLLYLHSLDPEPKELKFGVSSDLHVRESWPLGYDPMGDYDPSILDT